jgi:hypothetical protein
MNDTIPAHIINLAQRNAQLAHTRINIYKHNETWIIMPDGYAVPNKSQLYGYITAAGVLDGVLESSNSDETTEERRVNSH